MRNGIVLILAAAARQQVSTYRMLATVFGVIGCICLALVIALFFLFHMAGVLAGKLGITAKRTIKEIERGNVKEGGRKDARKKERAGVAKDAIENRGDREQRRNISRLDGQEDRESASAPGAGATVQMLPEDGGTCRLDEDRAIRIGKFAIVRDIVMVHTREII